MGGELAKTWRVRELEGEKPVSRWVAACVQSYWVESAEKQQGRGRGRGRAQRPL